jgi:hypothetical protein
MRLVCGDKEVTLSEVELTITRLTFTPGDVRVSREVCRTSLLAGGERVKVVPCRAGLRFRRADDQNFSVLALDETAELEDGDAVELCRGANGTAGVLAYVRNIAVKAVTAPLSVVSSPSVAMSPPVMAMSPPVMACPSASCGGGQWIKVNKVSKSSSASSSPAPEQLKEAEPAPAKRAKLEDDAAAPVAHTCRGRVRPALYVDATMQPKGEGAAAQLDERFQSVCVLNAQSVLECPDATFGDGKVSFWARETKRRGLVCEFQVFGLAKARRQEFKVALCFSLCEAASAEKLSDFLGDAFGELHSSVQGCMSAGADSQQDVEFQGSEAEQSLASLFASLSTECQPADQPISVGTLLRHHQLQALQWMMDKELVYVHQLPPFWQERAIYGQRPWGPANASTWGTRHVGMIRTFLLIVQRFNEDREWHDQFPKPLVRVIADMIPIETSYRHSLTGIETKRRPRGAMGGILADDMGE